ncbi:MAG: redoxin domain-containing protein, partial [Verrucomicrobiae bacterium]|nr:redoxin domain-containing protein [Verrucomicrobiae bacterium]
MSARPQPGDAAPSFSAPVMGGSYADGDVVSLKDFKGQKVILYFYPKDDTPGCTTQACGIRDVWGELSQKAAIF